MEKVYMCIDLKSFYASCECVMRGLDPLKTNLVVADPEKTEKTICLAVTPSLKEYGIGGRARLYEVVTAVKKINQERFKNNGYKKFRGKSYNAELLKDKTLMLDYIIAPPQMGKYVKFSTQIYNIYLKYVSKEDMLVYSIDEVFCDITSYLKSSGMDARSFVTMIIHDVYKTTGITATAGIGTNLYLAKIAMDIVAKKADADEYGVRIAYLDERKYREELWEYKPLTKFWRIGPGIAARLESNGMKCMGDVARMSIENEELLYKLFGINAELIIDHAWGWEGATIDVIKQYKPISKSVSSGQVLAEPYDYEKTKLIIREMSDLLSLDLTARKVKTNQIILDIGYDVDNLKNNYVMSRYEGKVSKDHYGRSVPSPAHGSINIDHFTSSSDTIRRHCVKLYDQITNKLLTVRRINITAANLVNEGDKTKQVVHKQMDIFSSGKSQNDEIEKNINSEEEDLKIQNVMLDIKKKYGKNAILRGMNLIEGGTTIKRNGTIGGHNE